MRRFLLGVSLAAIFAAPASASTVTNSFNVLLTINAQCQMTKPADVNFGAVGIISAALTQTTSVQVVCTNTTPYTLGLDGEIGRAHV